MYTREELAQFPCFEKELALDGPERLLDPLTGVVTRETIISLARCLIERKTPFSFAIVDLDTFKFINDTYGHHAGDVVLQETAEALRRFVGDRGLVGRFGGDEFLMINTRDVAYDEVKAFFVDMYDGRVLRRNVEADDCSPFVTGTAGSASFPADAQDYDALFDLIDKTLYRGKSKGRNCYIIYVPEKHRNIEIRLLARKGLSVFLEGAVRQIELVPGLMNKLKAVMPLVMEEMQIPDLYYVGKKGVLRSVRNESFAKPAGELDQLMAVENLYSTNRADQTLAETCPVLYGTLKEMSVETVLAASVGMGDTRDGYLLAAVPHSQRIWQDNECAALLFIAKMLAAQIRLTGEELDG